MGNPWVYWCLRILKHLGTLNCDLHGFTHQQEPKNMENGGEMSEIHLISMIFTKLAVSHSVLHQKICSWTFFEGLEKKNCSPSPPMSSPVTCVGTKNLCIFLINTKIHRYSVPAWVTGKD